MKNKNYIVIIMILLIPVGFIFFSNINNNGHYTIKIIKTGEIIQKPARFRFSVHKSDMDDSKQTKELYAFAFLGEKYPMREAFVSIRFSPNNNLTIQKNTYKFKTDSLTYVDCLLQETIGIISTIEVQGYLKVKKIDKQKISGELKLYIYSDKQVNTFPLGDDENYLSKDPIFIIDAYFEDVDVEYM